MRRLLSLSLLLLLMGTAGGAFAARYQWNSYFVTDEPTCLSVGDRVVDSYRITQAKCALDGYFAGDVGWWLKSTSGVVRNVGDACSLSLLCATGAGAQVVNVTATLTDKTEEDVLDDVGAVPIQRVLLLVGCALMFGIGWIAGK